MFCLSLFMFNVLVLYVLFICIFSKLQSLQPNFVLNFERLEQNQLVPTNKPLRFGPFYFISLIFNYI